MVTQTYDLNLIPGGQIVNVHVSQYDVGRIIAFNLLNGTTVFTPPSGSTALIEGTKPDKKGFSLSATLSGSTASFTTTQNMCAVAGKTVCEFRLKQGSRNIGTANFILDVERAGLADDVDLSTSELAPYMDAAKKSADAAATSATNAAASATNAANSAKTAAASASTASAAATTATNYGNLAKSYAVGGTGTRSGEDTDNAKYYAGKAAASVAQGTQVTFFMRGGHVYVQQTISGVVQPEQDLGEVTSTPDYVFDTVDEMNAAIAAGTVEDGATCYIKEDIINADSTNY